jgi:hypothetical protein
MFIDNLQIPDKVLEHRPSPREPETVTVTVLRDGGSLSPQSRPSDDESGNYIIHDASHKGQNGRPQAAPRPRRLSESMYEDGDAVMDPESGKTGSST